jgi:hypothetical protein
MLAIILQTVVGVTIMFVAGGIILWVADGLAEEMRGE